MLPPETFYPGKFLQSTFQPHFVTVTAMQYVSVQPVPVSSPQSIVSSTLEGYLPYPVVLIKVIYKDRGIQ